MHGRDRRHAYNIITKKHGCQNVNVSPHENKFLYLSSISKKGEVSTDFIKLIRQHFQHFVFC
jgi:hypothetical protein